MTGIEAYETVDDMTDFGNFASSVEEKADIGINPIHSIPSVLVKLSMRGTWWPQLVFDSS